MLDWMTKRGLTATRRREPVVAAPRPGRAMSGEYLLLYNYLEGRYATTVVLTFAQIEDLLGFVLPEQARRNEQWWTDAEKGPAGRITRILDPGPEIGHTEPGGPDRGVRTRGLNPRRSMSSACYGPSSYGRAAPAAPSDLRCRRRQTSRSGRMSVYKKDAGAQPAGARS